MRDPIKQYSVSQVTNLVKAAINARLPARLVVRGELGDWKQHHSSGHCYFTLKDKGSVLPAVMWAGKFKSVRFEPEAGMEVLATGIVDVYPVGGKYQFYADKLEPQGMGALQLAFEQMVAKLQAEGLFEDEHKKPIPSFAERIGVLTSESGAAIHDISESIFSRWPPARLFLFPVPVQGPGAARAIADTIDRINRAPRRLGLDLLIVGRGGGSLEDLWAFNEEVVARAIYASSLPIITAVGHEVDTTVADLVADARASTPTKAAMVAVPDGEDIAERLRHYRSRLVGSLHNRVQLGHSRLNTIRASEVFKKPATVVWHRQQQLDELMAALRESLRDLATYHHEQLNRYVGAIQRLEPYRLLGARRLELDRLANRTANGIATKLERGKMILEARAGQLMALSSKSVLGRGFTLTKRKKTGAILRTAEGIRSGDLLLTEFGQGKVIESQVTSQ